MITELFLGQVHRDELHSGIKEKEMELRKLLPEEWTPLADVNPVMIGFNLKLLGFNWQTNQQYAFFMGQLQDLKIVEIQGMNWRRSPEPIYQTQQG